MIEKKNHLLTHIGKELKIIGLSNNELSEEGKRNIHIYTQTNTKFTVKFCSFNSPPIGKTCYPRILHDKKLP